MKKDPQPVPQLMRQTKHFLGEHFEAFVLIGVTHGEQELVSCALCPKTIQAVAMNQTMQGILVRGGVISDVAIAQMRPPSPPPGELPSDFPVAPPEGV